MVQRCLDNLEDGRTSEIFVAQTCFASVSEFENNHIVALQEKRAHHKENPFINNTTAHVCHMCGRQCAAAIGLVSHLQSHKR